MFRIYLLTAFVALCFTTFSSGCVSNQEEVLPVKLRVGPENYWKHTWLTLKPGDRLTFQFPSGEVEGVGITHSNHNVAATTLHSYGSGITEPQKMIEQPRLRPEFPFACLIYRIGKKYYYGGNAGKIVVGPRDGGALDVGINMPFEASYRSRFKGFYEVELLVKTSK